LIHYHLENWGIRDFKLIRSIDCLQVVNIFLNYSLRIAINDVIMWEIAIKKYVSKLISLIIVLIPKISEGKTDTFFCEILTPNLSRLSFQLA
jgi:hypothetical protein